MTLRRSTTDHGQTAVPRSTSTLSAPKTLSLRLPPSALSRASSPKTGSASFGVRPNAARPWVFDLVIHIALGREYRGRRVEPGSVVYIACEGERGLRARNAAFRQAKRSENEDPPLYLLATRLDLVGEVKALILDIAAQIPPGSLAAIVVDTLNRSIRGSESSDEDMSAYVAAADALRDYFKCTVIIVHHCGVEATRPRGHTSLTGAADAQLAITRDAVDKVSTTIEYMKDGAEGEPLASTLHVVKLGLDDNGNPITSLVVEPADAPATQASKKHKKLPDSAIIALKQLKNLLATPDTAKLIPESSGVKRGTRGIKIDLLRKQVYQAGVAKDETADAQRMRFNRGLERLIADQIVGCWGEYVWIP